MASASLYPPSVDSYAAAFIASGDSAFCRLYFSLSKISTSTSPINSIHISVVKQSSGQSVVNKSDNTTSGRYRGTGIIILNAAPIAVPNKDNLYYVDILNEDIKGGWTPGWIYKIQIRLSLTQYNGTIGQAAWLNANAHSFSEWSTYCTTKAIGLPRIVIPVMKNFDSDVEQNSANSDKTYNLSLSTMEFTGTYSNTDVSETLYSYSLKLYDNMGHIIEDSDLLYTNQYYNPNQFYYMFKHEFEDNKTYVLKLKYTTINKYEDELIFTFLINQTIIEKTPISAITIDNIEDIENDDFKKAFKAITSLPSENEEGRVAIKLFSNDSNPYNGNICLRRSDSKDNFSTWTDIKIIACANTLINNLPIIFDYTIESGVWYKYGVQTIDTTGDRGIMNPQHNSLIREFEYAYLLGEGGRQLKLNLNNTVSSYTYNYSENKVDTIGGHYPFITRNGNMKYRTFPLSCMISFNMDDQNTFTSDKELYQYDDIISKYNTRRRDKHLGMYDYKREFDFREKVLAFLQDGKPKLFKSATEGNIIIRLMTVTEQPNQQLNRMIGTFSSQAHEIAEANMANYLKYKFYEVGNWSTNFTVYTTKLGQLDLDFNVGDNIIEKIWEIYDHSSQNIAGNRLTLKKVHHLSLEFTDKPLRVINNAFEEVIGNNILYGATKITIYGGRTRYYYFDENIEFTKGSSLTVLGDVDGEIKTVHITVDFLYEIGKEPYVAKEIDSRTSSKGLGQIYNSYAPGTNIYNDIYYKFYYEWKSEFRRLARVSWTCIEANPGAVFQIQDGNDDPSASAEKMYHEINQTGILNIEDLGSINGLKYIGMRNHATGEIDKTVNCDCIIDYIFYTTEGTYKEES